MICFLFLHLKINEFKNKFLHIKLKAMPNLNHDNLVNTENTGKEEINNSAISPEPSKTVAPTSKSAVGSAEISGEKNEGLIKEDCSSVCTKKEENLLEFNRKNIEKQSNNIHLVDNDETSGLDMFCFVKCTEEDTDLVKQCRGVVFKGDKLVMKAFPYTSEFNHLETDKIADALGSLDDWHFYESQEGTLIRLFFFDTKWFVSTHRKLNAFRSKWASRESFGVSFKNALIQEEKDNKSFTNFLGEGEDILERFQSSLDKNKQYMFLVRNTPENRIVCDAPENPKVYHVGTFTDGKLNLNEDIKLSSPKKLDFTNIEDLLEYVKSLSYKDLQGVICFNLNNTQVKVLHKDYQDLFIARGNEPSIKFRYLQARMNRRMTNMLYHLYPRMAQVFDEYENTLYDISRSIYRAYVQRFIKKRYVTVPREEFAVIRECHAWHLTNRTENRISLNKIISVMNQQSPTHLNHMIRRFKLEQTRQQNDQEGRTRSDSIRSFEQSPAPRVQSHQKLSPLLLSSKKNFPNPPALRNSFLPRKVVEVVSRRESKN